jgi:hypothetical protein
MQSHFTLHPDECSKNAKRVHDELMQATELQLHRAVGHAVEDYRENRKPTAQLSVNLLPALRIRYGNLLNEQLLTAEIVLNNPEDVIYGRTSRTDLLQAGLADIAFFFTSLNINDSEPVLWDCHNSGQPLPPTLEVGDLMAFVENLADARLVRESVLFTGHAQSVLMSQANSQDEFGQLEWELKNEQGAAAFYKAAFETIVDADKTPTLVKIYQSLKESFRLQIAHGIGSEAATTYWLELGKIADEGSDQMLGNVAQSEIEGQVRTALTALPEAEQLVLWQEHGGIRDFFYGDYRHALEAELSHDTDCFDKIVKKVSGWLMSSAMDDWHAKAEKA